MVEGVPTLVAPHAREQATEPPRLFRLLRGMRRDQRGVAVIEFALVAIPLFLLVLGIIDFGRALNYYNDMQQLAGQGARFAAVDQEPGSAGGQASANFQKDLAGFADSPELKAASNHLTVCINTPLPTKPGDPVVVQVNYSFHFIPLVSPITLPLSTTQTERFEGLTPHFVAGCAGP
jgi:Flp pilus assembly protein TadG